MVLSSHAPASARVLLVEADARTRGALTALLMAHGYDVLATPDGREAVEILQARPIDLVLSDLALPDGDGLVLTASVRQMGLLDVPIMLLCDREHAARGVTALDLGADDVVAKPVDAPELLARVRARLRRAERQAELTRHSTLDPLTLLLNRRGIAELFERERARLRRRGGVIALLVLDIDGFKPLNDARGHAAGDLVLQGLSRELERVVRTTDRVGRLGGDEFVILMPDTSERAAAELAKRVGTQELIRVKLGGRTERLKLSVGIASGDAHSSLDALLDVADAAMYRQKRAAS